MYNYLIYILEKIMEDTRRLIPMTIRHLEDNMWEVSIENAESYKIEGSLDEIKRALRRIKGKDGSEPGKCRSAKVGTYASMISDQDNNEHKINVWKSKVPHTAEEFKKLMESNGKIIKLTKNYLIEGNVFPKGTVLKLKEDKIEFLPSDIWDTAKEMENEDDRFDYVKSQIGDEFTDEEIKDFLNKYKSDLNKKSLKEEDIGFLPTDVWNKAKEISDENERFEYVKKEVGSEFSDDEIKSFLNKYKSDLNKKSIKRTIRESDEIDIMIDMLLDTLKSEKYIDEKDFKEVLKIARNSKELVDAWNVAMNADDKTFLKKENKFWDIFDDLCKEFKDRKEK